METINMRNSVIRILAASACIMSLASCVSEALVYEDNDTEIGFAPVTGVSTKIVEGAMETEYSQFETFGVFAWHKITDATDWPAFHDAAGDLVYYVGKISDGSYMASPFVYRQDSGVWGGGDIDESKTKVKYERVTDDAYKKGTATMDPAQTKIVTVSEPHYWPKSGRLAFAGYSPYKMLDIDQSIKYDEDGNDDITNGRYSYKDVNGTYDIGDKDHPCLTVADFIQGDYEWFENDHWAENETVDLMWFDIDDQDTFDSTTGNVPVTFRHACAWIDFRIYAENDVADGKFSIYDVLMSDIYWGGTFKSDDGNGNPVWELPDLGNLGGNVDRSDVFKDNVVLFNNTGTADANDDEEFVKVRVLEEDSFLLGGLMVIPQEVNSAVTIQYKQFTSDSGKPLLETFTVDLGTYTNEWEMGKHYVYDIVFGLDEIRVAPSTMDWEPVNSVVSVN